MSFTKEQRAKGGANGKRGPGKVTMDMRQKFKEALESVDLITDLKAVEPGERLRIVAMLSKYVIPSLASIELEVADVTIKQFMNMSSKEQDEYLETLKN